MFNYFVGINYSGKPHEINHLQVLKIQAFVDNLWRKYDKDKDGFLELQETKIFYQELVINRRDLKLTFDKHQDWFYSIDVDKDG